LGPLLADGLGDLPAVLALDAREQSRQVALQPCPDLDAPETMRDPLVQPLPRRRTSLEDLLD
jgi:hypothetical protein